MPSETETRYGYVRGIPWMTYEKYHLGRGWAHSPRGPDGKLRLTTNNYSKIERTMLQFTDYAWGTLPSTVTSSFGTEDLWARLSAESYSRLRGKLYKGSASLGLTIATYRQSRETIVNRYKSLDRSITELYAEALKRRRAERDVSSLYLEYVFGWAPLLSDIVAACSTVIQQAPQGGFVSAVSRGSFQNEYGRREPWNQWARSTGELSVKRSAEYVISNPNLWLAERAGLLNPLAIAWDAVPWSFVVNMFVNTGALVNSITDFTGVSFPTNSTTITERSYQEFYYFDYSGRIDVSRGKYFTKARSTGTAVDRPPLVLKLPKANWELAAIAASLVTQKLSKGGFFDKLPPSRNY